MTKEELLEKIKQQGAILEELKKQVEELSDDEKEVRTIPIRDEKYFYINSVNLYPYENNYPERFDYCETNENSSIGNYFKSEEDAEMVVRAMRLEQSIRIRRIELNDGWEPDWDDAVDGKYYVYITVGGYLTVYKAFSDNFLPVWGYYKSKEIAKQIIDEFKDDLEWYFNEYYPNKDKMYVWGD